MADSARFALHRPELRDSLERGEQKIIELMGEARYTYPAGTRLVRANEEHGFVYRLVEGWAGRNRLLTDGRNQFILLFLPGDLFAVKSMFMSQHVDHVETMSQIVVQRLDYKTLYTAFLADGDVASRCIWQVMEEERRLHSWVVGLGQGNADERLAMLLIQLRVRLTLAGVVPPESTSYDMPLTQQELADHLGVTSVHINRVLKVLREQNILSIRGRSVTIHDLEALRKLALPLLDAHDRQASRVVSTAERGEPA